MVIPHTSGDHFFKRKIESFAVIHFLLQLTKEGAPESQMQIYLNYRGTIDYLIAKDLSKTKAP